ncbi:hypothetical protein [Actinoplanes sp. G11-F43]|uniref:hypothetical protein n=1 Tax=Actinoplanes sp. G11-F43 TaxID=3424130 RepID=UPI003D329315
MPADAERHDRLVALYRNRVAGYEGVPDDYSRRWSRWCQHLLQYGGELVVPHRHPEHHLDDLLASAAIQPAPSRFVPGDDNGCHANAAMLWTDGMVAAIGTGYALSDDGLWRQHSWGVDADGAPVETTAARISYVGITLTAVPALQFAVSNAGDHVKAALKANEPRSRELTAILIEARRQYTSIRPE